MVDRTSDGVVLRPFSDVNIRVQRSVEGSSSGDTSAHVGIALCRKCERELQMILSLRTKKRREREINAIYSSFFRRKERALTLSTQRHTVQALKYFMHGKGSVDCTDGGHYRPLRLENRSDAIRKAWRDHFAQKAGVGSFSASELLQNCRDEVLCPSYTSLMSNCLLYVELGATRCSVCHRQEKKRGKQEVRVIDHECFQRNEDVMCLVENALAVYTENAVQLLDVKQICAPCRLVVFRQISVRENRPRQDVSGRVRFDYGPTPSAIRKSINCVRKMLSMKGKLIVFLSDVWSFYHTTVNEAEKSHEIKDARTLKKYILPSLASTGIYLEMGSRKVGSYLCTNASFSELAKDIKRNAKNPSSEAPVDEMSADRERKLLMELFDVLKRKFKIIEQSQWSLRDFIVCVPVDLWRRKVIVRGSNRLLRRFRAAANIRNVQFYDEWPCSPTECPMDLHLRPNHEQKFVSTIFCMLEQDAFEVSNRSSQGPLNYSLTLCGYMRADKEFVRLLNRVGITGSYQSSQRIKNAAIYQHMEQGAFSQTVGSDFHTVAVDNVNVHAKHIVAVHGNTYHGFNGTAAQAVNSNVAFNLTEFLRARPQSELEVKRLEGMKREKLVEEMFSTHSDLDLKGFGWIVVGLVLEHREQLASTRAKEQRSFRGLLLDAFKGYSGGKSKVTYVDVNRSNAQDLLSIVRQLGLIEKALVAKESETTFVGVVGDQPVFKILFELWYDSYLKNSKLHKWMIPISGGFHIDKQGLVPLNKTFLAGVGQEEMVSFCGLSQAHQDGFFSLPHYRKNRRVLHQICAAQILRVADVIAENPSVETQLQSLMCQPEGESRDDNGGMNFKGRANHSSVTTQEVEGTNEVCDVKSVLPDGCSLEVTDLVTRNTVMIGKLVCDEIEKLSEHSKNFRYLAKQLLLELLIPSTGYHVMCRRGQTETMDKFWFFSAGVLHVTNKINYMENMLYYAFIKKSMPHAAYETIYRFRHLVMSFSADCLKSNPNLDEAMEVGLVRHLKMLTTNDPDVLERSVAWLKLICRAFDVLRRELNSSPTQTTRTDDLPSNKDQLTSETRRDREKKTALNVLMMYEFLTTKDWLSEANRASEFLTSVLVSPPFELKDKKLETQLLEADKIGRTAASLHISRKFPEVFGGLSKQDIDTHLKGKEPKTIRASDASQPTARDNVHIETASDVGRTRRVSIYLHGVEFLISFDVRDAPLQEILFSRTENLFIISRRGGLVVRKSGDILTNAFYDAKCCWRISEQGFERMAAGDSGHAESGMRFVHALLNISKPNFVSSELESKDRKALMISNDQSNPIISLIPELLGLFTIYHRVENEVIDVTALRQQLYRTKICPEEMAVVFALSGGDLCPPTQHFRMICFADALIRYRHKLKPFIYPDLWDDVSRYSEQNWLNMENVIAAAYVVSLQSTNTIEDPPKSMFSKLNPDDETQDWAHEVRKWVAQLKRVDRATRFMPEKADLQLQLRRAMWLLRYWKCAIKFGCQDEQQQSQYGEQGNDGDSYGNHAQM